MGKNTIEVISFYYTSITPQSAVTNHIFLPLPLRLDYNIEEAWKDGTQKFSFVGFDKFDEKCHAAKLLSIIREGLIKVYTGKIKKTVCNNFKWHT